MPPEIPTLLVRVTFPHLVVPIRLETLKWKRTKSFPEPGAVGGFPGAGPASGVNPGAMMMAAMPKPEFIVAASIEPEKWLKLKAAPP